LTQKLVFVLFLITFSVGAAKSQDIELPSLGNDSSDRFSAAEEKLLGETFMRQVRLGLPISNDPEVTSYLQHLGYRLIANSNYHTRHFKFFLINDASINAFAGPNGYIGVNAGLMLATQDESELASVLAHEIAHVTQRHLERSFDSGEKLSIPTAAAIITAIVLGSQANINITEAAIFATIAANYQSKLSYSRTHELEADHIGMQILTKAQFDAQSMPSFFEKLNQNRMGDAQIPEFLSTHPVTVKRIAESKNRASLYEFRPKENSYMYYLIKAKLRVITADDRAKLAKRLAAELEEGSYQNHAAQLYAYSLALLESDQADEAFKQVEKLIKLDGEKIPYLILKANIEIERNNTAAGFSLFSETLSLNPGNPAISLHYADALLTDKQPNTAKQLLHSMNDYQPTPLFYQMLAKAEGDSGNSSASHEMLAEYYLMYDQIPIAVNHLQQALRDKKLTSIDKQRIENRMAEMREIAILEQEF